MLLWASQLGVVSATNATQSTTTFPQSTTSDDATTAMLIVGGVVASVAALAAFTCCLRLCMPSAAKTKTKALYVWTERGVQSVPHEQLALLDCPSPGDAVTPAAMQILKDKNEWAALWKKGGVVKAAQDVQQLTPEEERVRQREEYRKNAAEKKNQVVTKFGQNSLLGDQYPMGFLLNPPTAVSREQARCIKSASQELLSCQGHKLEEFYPEVFVSHDIGTRGIDEADCGPGIFHAGAVTKYLWQNDVPCFSSLMVPPREDPRDYDDKLGSVSSNCKVLVVVETCALYLSEHCYGQISMACQGGIEIIRLRFDPEMPNESDKWPWLQGLAHIPSNDSRAISTLPGVLKSLLKTAEIPTPPATVPQAPRALDNLLALIHAKLEKKANGKHGTQTQNRAVEQAEFRSKSNLDESQLHKAAVAGNQVHVDFDFREEDFEPTRTGDDAPWELGVEEGSSGIEGKKKYLGTKETIQSMKVTIDVLIAVTRLQRACRRRLRQKKLAKHKGSKSNHALPKGHLTADNKPTLVHAIPKTRRTADDKPSQAGSSPSSPAENGPISTKIGRPQPARDRLDINWSPRQTEESAKDNSGKSQRDKLDKSPASSKARKYAENNLGGSSQWSGASTISKRDKSPQSPPVKNNKERSEAVLRNKNQRLEAKEASRKVWRKQQTGGENAERSQAWALQESGLANTRIKNKATSEDPWLASSSKSTKSGADTKRELSPTGLSTFVESKGTTTSPNSKTKGGKQRRRFEV